MTGEGNVNLLNTREPVLHIILITEKKIHIQRENENDRSIS